MTRDEETASVNFNSLYFYLEDENGRVFESLFENGYGYSESLADGCIGWYMETPWFTGSGKLSLHVTAAAWSDWQATEITVDVEAGTASGLPEGITYLGMEHDAYDPDRTAFRFSMDAYPSALPRLHPLRSPFLLYWKDPDSGDTSNLTSGGCTLYLDEKYEGSSIIFFLNYTCWDYDMDAVFPIN